MRPQHLKPSPLNQNFRTIHRYLGFFLAGIMAVYAISGMILVFRNTDFLKTVTVEERQLSPGLSDGDLAANLKQNVRVEKQEGSTVFFRGGTYDQSNGKVVLTKKELPYLLGKMEKMHKATTESPLYYLNLFFGLSLLFFVISAFWMYSPKMPVFKKGLYFTLAGIVLTLIMLFV